MQISAFYNYVRTLTRANALDLTDSDIATLANPEADYLYELTIQGYHLQQTQNQTPTVLTFTQTVPFQATDNNLWIEQVNVSVDGGVSFYQIERTNNTDFIGYLDKCGGGSLTDQLAETDGRPTHFVQTSQGINVFPMAPSVITKIYIKNTPVIDWNNLSYNILLPKVPINLLALKTALMYRDINDTNQLAFLEKEYAAKFRIFEKRIAKGGRSMQMRQVSNEVK